MSKREARERAEVQHLLKKAGVKMPLSVAMRKPLFLQQLREQYGKHPSSRDVRNMRNNKKRSKRKNSSVR